MRCRVRVSDDRGVPAALAHGPRPAVDPLSHRPAAPHQHNEALGAVLARPQPALPPLRPAPALTARQGPPPGDRPRPHPPGGRPAITSFYKLASSLRPALSLRRQGVEPRPPLPSAGRVHLLWHDLPAPPTPA